MPDADFPQPEQVTASRTLEFDLAARLTRAVRYLERERIVTEIGRYYALHMISDTFIEQTGSWLRDHPIIDDRAVQPLAADSGIYIPGIGHVSEAILGMLPTLHAEPPPPPPPSAPYVCTFCPGAPSADTNSSSMNTTVLSPETGVCVHITTGFHGLVVAYTHEHTASIYPFEFKRILVSWLTENVGLRPEILPYLSFSLAGAHSDALLGQRPMTLPKGFSFPSFPNLADALAHPAMAVNVFQLNYHQQLPVRVADELTLAAQRYVGYFYGQEVRASQMSQRVMSSPGAHYNRDLSVHFTGEPWHEPFEPGDDCVFCQRMSDQSITDRIAGFQYMLEHETGMTSGMDGYHLLANWQQRVQENRARAHEADPERWQAFDLTTLPPILKRSLCIEWNHIYRDWLRDDPRYAEKNGEYWCVYTERLDGPDTRPSLRVRDGQSVAGEQA